MKKMSFIILILVFCCYSAWADNTCYVGVYNSGEAPETTSVYVDSLYQHYDAWVWMLPGDEGLKGFSYKIALQGDVCAFYIIHPDIKSSINNPVHADGWAATFGYGMCKYDWVWVVKLDLITSSMEPHSIEILENPLTENIEAASCVEGYPIVPLIVLDQLLVSPSVETDEKSWGAVKSMYRDP